MNENKSLIVEIETTGQDDPKIVSFHDLPKARQHRAVQAWAEGLRQFGATRGGTVSARRLRRAAAARARRSK